MYVTLWHSLFWPCMLQTKMSNIDTLQIAASQLCCLCDSTCLGYVLLTNEQFKVVKLAQVQTTKPQINKDSNVLSLSTAVHSAARFLPIHHLKPGYTPSTVLDLSKKGDWPISLYHRANIWTNKGQLACKTVNQECVTVSNLQQTMKQVGMYTMLHSCVQHVAITSL